MESILVKIFATALALSQVTTTPDAVKTQFDRVGDQEQVAHLLRAGCTHMRKAFDIEDINLEELIATALDDPEAVAGENKVFRGINFADLQMAYREFCKNEKVAVRAVDLGDVIDFYNKAAADLPDHNKLKGMRLPGASVVLDRKGERFAEVLEENQRRVWVSLADIPEHVQKAFLAAEDSAIAYCSTLKIIDADLASLAVVDVESLTIWRKGESVCIRDIRDHSSYHAVFEHVNAVEVQFLSWIFFPETQATKAIGEVD